MYGEFTINSEFIGNLPLISHDVPCGASLIILFIVNITIKVLF
jgi:hypothetical protein